MHCAICCIHSGNSEIQVLGLTYRTCLSWSQNHLLSATVLWIASPEAYCLLVHTRRRWAVAAMPPLAVLWWAAWPWASTPSTVISASDLHSFFRWQGRRSTSCHCWRRCAVFHLCPRWLRVAVVFSRHTCWRDGIRESWTGAWHNEIAVSKGNTTRLWRTFRDVLGEAPCDETGHHSAEDFASFFRDKVDGDRASTSSMPIYDVPLRATPTLAEWTPVSPDETEKLISTAVNKTCDLDPAPTWLVKQMRGLLSPFITLLFNKSRSQAVFLQHSSRLLSGRC